MFTVSVVMNLKKEKSIETSTIPGLIYNVKEYQKICNHVWKVLWQLCANPQKKENGLLYKTSCGFSEDTPSIPCCPFTSTIERSYYVTTCDCKQITVTLCIFLPPSTLHIHVLVPTFCADQRSIQFKSH